MHWFPLGRLVGLAMALGASACPAMAIEGGRQDGASGFPSVYLLRARSGSMAWTCTGVAVATRVIATAGHCILREGGARAEQVTVHLRSDGAPVTKVARSVISPVYERLIREHGTLAAITRSGKRLSHVLNDNAYLVTEGDVVPARTILDVVPMKGPSARNAGATAMDPAELKAYASALVEGFQTSTGEFDAAFVGYGPAHCGPGNGGDVGCGGQGFLRRRAPVSVRFGATCDRFLQGLPHAYKALFWCVNPAITPGDSGGGLFLRNLRGEFILVGIGSAAALDTSLIGSLVTSAAQYSAATGKP